MLTAIVKSLTPAAMVDNLAEKVDVCSLNRYTLFVYNWECEKRPLYACQGFLMYWNLWRNDQDIQNCCMSDVEGCPLSGFHCRLARLVPYSLRSSCVSSGGAPTPAGTSMFTMWKIYAHMRCECCVNVADLQHFDIELLCSFSICNAFCPTAEIITVSLLVLSLSQALVVKVG